MHRLFKEFEESLCKYQDLWNELDILDNSVFILEPHLPARRSITERRIALHSISGGLSVHLKLDPLNARSIPLSVRFIGVAKQANKLREKFNQYIAGKLQANNSSGSVVRWNEMISVKENLEICLGDLPSPVNSKKSDFIQECGICYANRLDEAGSLPDVSRPNIKTR